LGPDHPDTLNSMWGVAKKLVELNRGAEAIPVIDEALRRAAGKDVHPALYAGLVTLRMEHLEKVKDAAGCRATAELWEALRRTDPRDPPHNLHGSGPSDRLVRGIGGMAEAG